MGKISVHEFYALDGVFDNPTWTADFGSDPKMGDTIGAITGSSTAILLGRTTGGPRRVPGGTRGAWAASARAQSRSRASPSPPKKASP